MTLTVELLENLYDEHILIKIENSEVQQAELMSQKYVNQTGKNHAYINSIVQNCVIKWMEENLDLEQEKIVLNLPKIWNFVNGSSLTFKNKKLILIPSEVISLDEIVIPQEWVDIPTWAGDYYLPVKIDLEQKYLHIWGYVSRKTLLEKGEYNASFCNYYVDAEHLINEIDLLWIACKICQEKGSFKPLVTLREIEAETLIKEYREEMNKSPYSPRLKGDFQKWMTLLNNQKWLQQLTEPIIIDLRKWLDEQFDQAIALGWQLLRDVQPQWSGVLSTRVERAKLINLQVQPQPQSVILLLEVTAENDGRYRLLIQVNPSQSKFLPANLNLAFCLKSGEKLQSITSRKSDNCMKLEFLCDRGDEFRIEVSLEGVTVIENFCI